MATEKITIRNVGWDMNRRQPGVIPLNRSIKKRSEEQDGFLFRGGTTTFGPKTNVQFNPRKRAKSLPQQFQWLWENFPMVRSHQIRFHHLSWLALRARLYDNINIHAAVKLTTAWWGLSKHGAQSAEGLAARDITTAITSLLLLKKRVLLKNNNEMKSKMSCDTAESHDSSPYLSDSVSVSSVGWPSVLFCKDLSRAVLQSYH